MKPTCPFCHRSDAVYCSDPRGYGWKCYSSGCDGRPFRVSDEVAKAEGERLTALSRSNAKRLLQGDF